MFRVVGGKGDGERIGREEEGDGGWDPVGIPQIGFSLAAHDHAKRRCAYYSLSPPLLLIFLIINNYSTTSVGPANVGLSTPSDPAAKIYSQTPTYISPLHWCLTTTKLFLSLFYFSY